MARRLPLFPLDVVLLPGTLLPLHIFEPRYRRMLQDCLRTDRQFGIIPVDTDENPPPIGVVGTIAQVRGTQPLDDGRTNIAVSGEGRFRLETYLDDPAPYLVGMVEPFEDEPDEAAAPERVAELRSLGERCVAALLDLTGTAQTLEWSGEPGLISFQVASLLQVDRDFQQRFLRIRSARHRIVLLLELLPPMLTDLEKRATVRNRAKRNGKGGVSPDIQIST